MTSDKERREHIDNESVASYIRPLALVVFRRPDGCILVAPGFDHVKQQHFYRPLGGGIEFGERAEDAARREILEELGAEIEGLQLLGTFENLFTYRGQPGHELIWLYEARFADASLYEHDVLEADESGAKFEVHWVPLAVFEKGEAPLFPEGLLEMLLTGTNREQYHEGDMGLTHVNVEIASVAEPTKSERIRLLVDSGAYRSAVPAPMLERLGIQPIAEDSYMLANGDSMTRRRGVAIFKFEGRIGASEVVFGEPGDYSLIGVLTLESLGLALNPLRRELYEVPQIMAGIFP
jgi:ADP-ribose pyrophosphatase YjhB (NUDIX family)/predicted aspartyl protease